MKKSLYFCVSSFTGSWFTWEQGNLSETNTRKHLDRCLAKAEWEQLFPNFSLKHLSHSFSDHCPLLFQMTDKDFRIENDNLNLKLGGVWKILARRK